MKNILLGSLAFFLFSISVSILQTSCDKDADAEPNNINEVNQLNKIVFYQSNSIWTANYDGSGQQKINIILPSGYEFYDWVGPKISPDGKKIFFDAEDKNSGMNIFSCDIDGSNLIKVISYDGSRTRMGEAY